MSNAYVPADTRSRCNRCFAEKDVSTVLQGSHITCCRACRYKISEVMDFLTYHGISVVVSGGGDEEQLAVHVAAVGAPVEISTDDQRSTADSKLRRGQKKTG